MTFKKAASALAAALMYLGIYLLWQVILVFAATFGVSFYFGIEAAMSGGSAMQMMQPEFTQRVLDTVLRYAVHLTAVSAVLTIITYFVMFKVRKKSFFSEISLKRISPIICGVSLVLGVALNVVMTCLVSAIPFPQSWINEYNEAISAIVDTDIYISVIFTAILAPICEEIVMRGLVHTRLKRIMPMFAAMIISSWIFGMIHGVMIQICYAALLGLMLSWVFEKSGSLLAPILFHIGFNSCGLLIGGLEGIPFSILALCILISIGGVAYIQRTSKYKIEFVGKKADTPLE